MGWKQQSGMQYYYRKKTASVYIFTIRNVASAYNITTKRKSISLHYYDWKEILLVNKKRRINSTSLYHYVRKVNHNQHAYERKETKPHYIITIRRTSHDLW